MHQISKISNKKCEIKVDQKISECVFLQVLFSILQGRVARKLVNTNPGLKVNQNINFSCIKMFSTAYVLCSLSLVKLKTEGHSINRKPHRKFTKLKSKFSLILD